MRRCFRACLFIAFLQHRTQTLSGSGAKATSVRSECWALGATFPTASGLMRTVALIGQERTSKIILNGVSVALRKRLKPASVAT